MQLLGEKPIEIQASKRCHREFWVSYSQGKNKHIATKVSNTKLGTTQENSRLHRGAVGVTMVTAFISCDIPPNMSCASNHYIFFDP
jgi:hypothetical protein